MTTATVRADSVTTRDHVVEVVGERRARRKVCCAREIGGVVTLEVYRGATVATLTYAPDEMVEVVA